MGKLIPFGKNPAAEDRDALLAALAAVREEIAWLDLEEPEDMDSEAHTLWGDRHEELEDQADDILDLLDTLPSP